MGIDNINIKELRGRWSGNLVNQVVLALNQGASIRSILKQVPSLKVPPLPAKVLDLRGIDLSHQNLRGPWRTRDGIRKRIGVNLRGADLTGALLKWTILPRADLRNTCLKGAELQDAELIYANLSGADLDNADLTGAWLLYTKFSEARVTEDQLNSRRNLGQLDFDYHAFEL